MQIFFGKLVLVFTALNMIVQPFIGSFIHGGESYYFEKWSKDQTFTRNYAVELEKTPGKDFVILNLTDIQLADSALEDEGKRVKKNIDRMVKMTKPDLITVTGDNAVTAFSYIQTIKWLDSYGIPWAPLMGNHDGQGCPSEFWCAYDFTLAKNCLFKFGPEGMGYGNYIVNITENGEIIHSIFLMDSHDLIEEDNINGAAGSGYDHFWPEQLEWYSWAINGLEAVAGRKVESTVLMHIPLYEYKDAWKAATGTDEVGERPFVGEYAETSFGSNSEGICCASQSNGFFDLVKEKGSTKNILCGHDHVNDSSIVYQGIRLGYGVKMGPGCYWDENKNGGTTLTIGSDGHVAVENHYIDFNAE